MRTWFWIFLFSCRGAEEVKQGVSLDQDADGFHEDIDCDDTNAQIHPEAAEICDEVDNDCDGAIDDLDLDLEDGSVWYIDTDQDGYGDDYNTQLACEVPDGYVEQGGDCNDQDSLFHPGAEEDCTLPIDFNCDGSIGYEDADGDHWAACEDCDDQEPYANGGMIEICDGIDNNCDEEIDEGLLQTFYLDFDSDQYGNPEEYVEACDPPEGYVLNGWDCDDIDTLVHPNGLEFCDGIDNNCDDVVDEDDALDALIWYIDQDEDGFGDVNTTLSACVQPTGYVESATDCDDNNNLFYPGAIEECDGFDSDCDGESNDDESVDASVWYLDADEDTYGDLDESIVSCEQPTGYVSNSSDCDDNDASLNTEGVEVCNFIDDDCNGVVDDVDSSLETLWYEDSDNDGLGDPSSTQLSCFAPTGYVAIGGDLCPTDGQKEEPGDCGCNVLDEDLNGNSITDCLEPTCTTSSLTGVYAGTGVLTNHSSSPPYVTEEECLQVAYLAGATTIVFSQGGNYPTCYYGPDTIRDRFCSGSSCGCGGGGCWANITLYECVYP